MVAMRTFSALLPTLNRQPVPLGSATCPVGIGNREPSDGLNRLKEFRRGTLDDPPDSIADGNTTRRQVFTLDQVGNWDRFQKDDDGFGPNGGSNWDLDQTRTSNKVNEITDIAKTIGADWIDPAHSARGNMTSGPKPGAETTKLHFKYDAWNRLIDVRNDDAGNPGTIIVTYRYDAAGRRIRKLLGADPGNPDNTYDYFFNNSWQILEVRKDGLAVGDLYEQYIWSLRYIDSPILRDRDTTGNGELDERLYYCNDANMNVTALVNTSGSVVERYVYDAYGKVTIYNADWSATVTWANSKKNEVLYCGYRYDPETGLYHVRNRMYHPTLGRWLQREPPGYEYVDGMSLYLYVKADPTGRIDPTGKALRYKVTGLIHVRGWPTSEATKDGKKPYRHSVIYFGDPKRTKEAVDFGPEPKYQDNILLHCILGCPGISSGGIGIPPEPVIPLNIEKPYDWLPLFRENKMTQSLAYTKDGFMVSCCDASDEQIKYCLTMVSKWEWHGTHFFVIGRNCWDFAEKAERACCLDPGPKWFP